MSEKRQRQQAQALTRKRETEERHRKLMQDHKAHKALELAQAEWDEFASRSRETRQVMFSTTGPCQ